MTLEHRTMDLFDAPQDAVLAHACNARGIWGTGVALGFIRRFPDAYTQYQSYCRKVLVQSRAGVSLVVNDRTSGREIACMITSVDYGANRDSEETILDQTRRAIISLELDLQAFDRGLRAGGYSTHEEVYLPRINSGMFGVPWEKTEAILQELVGKLPRKYIICTREST